ncbi:hypothetical protein [Bradyrhizobium ottawaense]|uniref:Uncharacterized protein n=1 Tax=Bradyrhizobium ottawaense TaxID=931866 RepID=A0ABV4FM91_9BRAD
MKKISATPFARRNLDKEIADLRDKNPADWGSAHLRRAHEIAKKRLGPEKAKEIVIQAVRVAHRSLKQAYREQLGEARRSALADFGKNCEAIANFTTPKRLGKPIRIALDELARTAFADGIVDLETVQEFFRGCKTTLKAFGESETASKIFKHLVTHKNDRTHGDIPPDEVRVEWESNGKDRTPKIALDYEVLPAIARKASEGALARIISEKFADLTAHDVFECLRRTSEPFATTTALKEQPNVLKQYLADLDALWTNHGLEIGRGNHPEDGSYSSPFHEFAERVLLALRDPRSRLFDPITDEESAAARAAYYKIPADFHISRDDISAMPFAGDQLITDWTLRTYLDSRPVSKKSE